MDDRLVTTPCPLCGSEAIEEIWHHQSGVTNGICTRCGHVYLCRRLTDAAIAASYEDYAQQYPEAFLLDENNLLFQIARTRVSFLERHMPGFPPATVLEVGCGYGHFLSLMRSTSDCHGIEPSREQAAFAREKFDLANIRNEGFESSEDHDTGPDVDLDLICSFHVLEHLVDPVRFLRFARRRLKRGGSVCLAVPDLSTLSPDLIELYFIFRSWHLHSFSRGTMTSLLRSQGFTVVAAQQEGATPMLRSSTIFIARNDASPRDMAADERLVTDSREAALRFHGDLDRRLEAICHAFEAWQKDQKRVAVYGGGIHTRALLSLAGVTPEEVAFVIDDDPAKEGALLLGVPVLSLRDALSRGVDVVVVSSLASEDAILARLEKDWVAANVTVKGIYRDLCDPTRKD